MKRLRRSGFSYPCRFATNAAFRFDSSRCLNCYSKLTGQYLRIRPGHRPDKNKRDPVNQDGSPDKSRSELGMCCADWTGAALDEEEDDGVMSYFSQITMDGAVAVETGASADVLFDLGLMFSAGTSGVVDLVAAHKWFNLAALKGRPDALGRRREIAEMMSDADIAAAQRAARAWLSTN